MRSLRALLTLLVLVVTASAATYEIRPGDTLSSVARRFGVSVGDIARTNQISNPNYVVAGRRIQVPGPGDKPSAAAAPAGVTAPRAIGVHLVRPGENLAVIARKYGTTVAEIKAANGTTSDRIYAGRQLKVPGAGPSATLCPVQGHHSIVNNYGAPRPGRRSHVGNDVFAARGTPVVAPVGGRLAPAHGAVAGLALYLSGDDGAKYYFAHLHSVARANGRVEAGTLIGTVGNTGNASALPPHLHVSISPAGQGPINPYPVLDAAC